MTERTADNGLCYIWDSVIFIFYDRLLRSGGEHRFEFAFPHDLSCELNLINWELTSATSELLNLVVRDDVA